MAPHSVTKSNTTSIIAEQISAATTSENSEKIEDQGKMDLIEPQPFRHFLSIWCILFALCLFSVLSALDETIITTSLPTIAREIGGSSEQLYTWIVQCFIFSSTIPQPLYSQISNIFGRRNSFLAAISLFALGSGIAGGAYSPAMLITGCTIQGLGAAGLHVLSDFLICDLVPPDHHRPYISVVLSTAGIGSTIGPFIGGAISDQKWRWIFYFNIPTSAISFFIMVVLLKTNYKRSQSWSHALARIDCLGALLFIPSTISLFYILITGGIQSSGSSWHIVLPLVLGICGWVILHVHQAMPWLYRSPSAPSHLFTNRSFAIGYTLMFLISILLCIIAYFLPLYFQTVKPTSLAHLSVHCLPFALAIIPSAGISGWALSKWGKYVPLHYVGFVLLAIGTGLFSALNHTSSSTAWSRFHIIPSSGTSLIFTATLPSTLAPLAKEDATTTTAMYSFTRSFGMVWGATIAGIVFNGHVNAHLGRVHDEGLRELLRNGAAYGFTANEEGLKFLKGQGIIAQVAEVHVEALRAVWVMAIVISLLGFVFAPFESSLELKNHTAENGLEKKSRAMKDEKHDSRIDGATAESYI